ncbi:MAG: hypothetical protein CMJ32_04175 [Phycisphaerae bacterium]|nr:hypothetical protein [Phycisphaerae bacterium]
MLKFEVFNESGLASEWPLVNAHLLGRDNVPVPCKIRFNNGRIECEGGGNQAVALCLQFDVSPIGKFMLQTTLLPHRQEPYNLALELARHRIQYVLAKSEDWQMTDPALGQGAMDTWERSREAFTAAIISSDPLHANACSLQALELSLRCSERLARAHAEILFLRRYSQKAASSIVLGTKVPATKKPSSVRESAHPDLDILVVPMNWRQLASRPGVYDWSQVDAWIELAQRTGKQVIAGPLIDLHERALPGYIKHEQADHARFRDLLYEHLEQVVYRYQSVVGIWNLCSGIHDNANIVLLDEQMVDLTRMASLLVRQFKRKAKTLVELTDPYCEAIGNRPDALSGFQFIDLLIQEGIHFDCIGLKLLFGESTQGRTMRDTMQISGLLDRLHVRDFPIMITSTGVPSEQVDPDGGWWREPYSDKLQEAWAGRMMTICLSRPSVQVFCWAELLDSPEGIMPSIGLVDGEGRAKPALARLCGLRRRMRKPLGDLAK